MALRPAGVAAPLPGEALPVDEALPALLRALADGRNAVLVAPPGAGKTTRVPLALLAAPWRGDGRILVLEPRRLAARGAAARMAATLGEPLGRTVGLRARLDVRVSAATRIEVVTEGVFTRMILDDPALEGVAAILFDEAHERGLDADLGLAFALDAQAVLRPDLRLLAMSATLDGARVAALLGDGDRPAPVIESQGRMFPVERRYRGRDPTRRIEDQMADAIMAALASEPGSVLAFLPGQGEIARVAERLGERLAGRPGAEAIDIVPLHGSLDLAAQDRAVRPAPPGRRKVVLATSIAETSLTIEGVRVVVDSGLARVPRHEPESGITRLETVRVSRAAAEQRAGRAGRLEPGVVYRLWDEPQDRALPPFAPPEILEAELSGLVLDCAAWGERDPGRLRFLDPPPAAALAEARALLIRLGALDAAGAITPHGRRLRALPLHPRLASMVLRAAAHGQAAAEEAALVAALLSERAGGSSTDLAQRLEAFRRETGPRAESLRALAAGWARIASGIAVGEAAGRPSLAALIGFAYPERLARARGEPGSFQLASGRGARLDPADSLARAPFLAVADLTGTAQAARILLAAPLDRAELERIAGDRITVEDTVSFDATAAALRARRETRLDALVLASEPRPVPMDETSAAALARGLAELGLDRLPWSPAQQQLRSRIAFLRRADSPDAPSRWPDLSDTALAATVESWLAPYLLGLSSLAEVTSGVLGEALDQLVPPGLRREIDAAAPSHFEAPTGHRFPIAYDAEGGPTVSVRVQELFGLKDHPRVGGGRLPLTLELLSPAHRPLQITRDLPGFWAGSWSAVRAEMRGRYPRHVWPEDPAAAAPTARAKPRGT